MIIMGDERIAARAVSGYLDVSDIMEMLNVPRNTVYTFLRSGRLKADSASMKNQRKKIEIDEFKKFLVTNPKYYSRVYGDSPMPDVSEVKEVTPVIQDGESELMVELFNKMEAIESLIKEHKETIEQLAKEVEDLEQKKEALEKVIDMF